MDKFLCVKCGHAADADENAARVIALKGIWLRTLPKRGSRAGTELPESLKFETFLKEKKHARTKSIGA